jgi:hypothetical protein
MNMARMKLDIDQIYIFRICMCMYFIKRKQGSELQQITNKA